MPILPVCPDRRKARDSASLVGGAP